MEFWVFIIASFIVVISWKYYRSHRLGWREVYIDDYEFPPRLKKTMKEKYPHLSEQDQELVVTALREYFHICNMAGNKVVGMPSQVVDIVWHEFILFTRHYQLFCRKALGRFLHHVPSEAMARANARNDGMRRAWRISCAREGIASTAPATLPLLFSIDKQLKIDDGFFYVPDCKSNGMKAFAQCATHIGCASGCSGSGVHSDSDGSWLDSLGGDDDSSGCSGGCGGD